MPTMNVDVDFQVWCSCGEGLCHATSCRGSHVTVEPCPVCLEKAKEEGYSDGYDAGTYAAEAKEAEDGPVHN